MEERRTGLEETLDEVASYEAEENARGGLPAWLTETPYWAISALVHAVLLLLVGGIVLLHREETEASTSMTMKTFTQKVIEYDPRKVRDPLLRNPEILNPVIDKPLITPETTIEPPKGDPDKIADQSDDISAVTEWAIGPGAGAGAGGENINFPGRGRPSGIYGTESSVLAALQWLRRHQHPDGHWSSDEYYRKEPKGPYKLVDYEGYSDGTGMPGFDVGVTALAMLAFLGFGETHRSGDHAEFRPVMRKAMKWLLEQQETDGPAEQIGRFGGTQNAEWMYNHALATMAMSELLLMTNDRLKLSRPVEKAVRFCLRAQNDGYGWRYGIKTARNDTSVTGWMVLALKTARQCARQRMVKMQSSEFREPFKGALAWLHAATGGSGRTGYQTPGDPGSSLSGAYEDPYPFDKEMSCMTAVGVLCRLFSGESRRDGIVRKGVDILAAEPPDWRPARHKRKSKINMYYWYYATYAMFQFGGSKWREWNKAMLDALVPTQIVGGDEDGSWDPIGEWGTVGGRVYATAINAMTLEVYYRFARATDDHDEYGRSKRAKF